MQLQDIRTAVLYRAGVDDADNAVPSAVLNSFINAAIREITVMRDWDWHKASETINSVVDQNNYTRASDCRNTVRVIDSADNLVLRQVTPTQAEKWKDISGRPAFWYVEGGSLYLSPTPSTVRAYTHWYLKSETALTGDTDEPAIPDYAIDLVIVKAALRVATRFDNTSLLQLLEREERDMIDALADDARRAEGPPGIDIRRDWTL